MIRMEYRADADCWQGADEASEVLICTFWHYDDYVLTHELSDFVKHAVQVRGLVVQF